MNSLYSHGQRQIGSLNADLETMAAAAAPSASLQGGIAASIAALSRTIDDFESMAKKELISAKQEKALNRVTKFRKEFKDLRDRFAALKKDQAAQAASTARASLLNDPSSSAGSRFRASVSAASGPSSSYPALHSPTHESPFAFRPNNPRSYQSQYTTNNPHRGPSTSAEYALKEDAFVDNAESQLDALISQGRAVLGDLVEQRGWLKATRTRLLSAANGVKGGRQVIGWVERRTKQDRFIFFGGAAFTLLCFVLIWWYLG